jgi:hypothetical protein
VSKESIKGQLIVESIGQPDATDAALDTFHDFSYSVTPRPSRWDAGDGGLGTVTVPNTLLEKVGIHALAVPLAKLERAEALTLAGQAMRDTARAELEEAARSITRTDVDMGARRFR